MKTIFFAVFLIIPLVFACTQKENLQTEWSDLKQKVADLHLQGELDKALLQAEQMLILAENKSNSEDLDVAVSLIFIGRMHSSLQDDVNLKQIYQRALSIRKNILGPDHVKVAESLIHMSEAYRDSNEYGRAALSLERALSIFEKNLGPYHPELDMVLSALVSFYDRLKDYDKGRPFYDQFMTILNANPNHSFLPVYLTKNAMFAEAIGQYAQAEILHGRAIKTAALFGPLTRAIAINNYAAFQFESGNYEKAELLVMEALAILEPLTKPVRTIKITLLESIVEVNLALRNKDKARKFSKQLALYMAEEDLKSHLSY